MIDRIVNDILKDDVVEKIIDTVITIQDSKSESPTLSALKSQTANVDKRINNLLNAMEEGIITSSTRQRLSELEDLKRNLEQEIAYAQADTIKLTRKELEYFFEELQANDIKDAHQQQVLVDTFINKIYLYDKRIVLIYNFTPHKHEYEGDIDAILSTLKGIPDISDMPLNGSSCWARTSDIMINSHALYRLS